MALRYLLLACLAAAVSAQGSGDLMPNDPVSLAQQNLTTAQRYERMESEMIRNNHFFCPDQGEDFIDDVIGNDNMRDVRVWTLFLQYPVLAYLDSVKKVALVGQIVGVINNGSSELSLTNNDICIGRVYHYDVSRYSESVLLNIYLRPGGSAISMGVNITTIDAAFRVGLDNANTDYIRTYLGRTAIYLSNDTYGMIQQNVHPGSFVMGGERFPVDEDPVLNAIVLGYWPRQYSLDDLDRNVNNTNTTASRNFAGNPAPINQGLTGGDIVFIVIATLLCALLAFLMVFGFCIQPFIM